MVVVNDENRVTFTIRTWLAIIGLLFGLSSAVVGAGVSWSKEVAILSTKIGSIEKQVDDLKDDVRDLRIAIGHD